MLLSSSSSSRRGTVTRIHRKCRANRDHSVRFEGAYAASGRRRRRRNGFSGSGRSRRIQWWWSRRNPSLRSGAIARFRFRVRGRLRDFRSASEASRRVFWKREIARSRLVQSPLRSDRRFPSYALGSGDDRFSSCSSRRRSLRRRYRGSSTTAQRELFFLQLPTSLSPSSSLSLSQRRGIRIDDE